MDVHMADFLSAINKAVSFFDGFFNGQLESIRRWFEKKQDCLF